MQLLDLTDAIATVVSVMGDHLDRQCRRSDARLAGTLDGTLRDDLSQTTVKGKVRLIEPVHQLRPGFVANEEDGIAFQARNLQVRAKALQDGIE